MLQAFEKLFGNKREKILKRYAPFVASVNALEEGLVKLSDVELRGKTFELKERLSKGETTNDIMPEAFALVRESSKRTLGQRHFDVQLIGGAILHTRAIAEMRTGEGKTLVATLPAYLNALDGKGVHIVTVNDYLSRRDGVWMGQIYSLLGLTVGIVNHEASYLYDPLHTDKDKERDDKGSFKVVHEFMRPVTRHEAYMADITYGTNNEFGFDYLRDNLEYEPDKLRQREFNVAIVDEIDSILIDEARTPLIISAPAGDSESLYTTFAGIAEKMNKDEDFEVEEKRKTIKLTDAGISKAENLLGVGNIYTDKGIKYVHHLETAVRAKALFFKDKEYVVQNNEVMIVDEFTGRIQPGRRWSEGLHQAIEAKEGVKIQQESRTFATITYQNYFRLYNKLSGMTGTAFTSSEEFFKVYGLDVIEVPTHRPVSRIDNDDLIFQTTVGKYKAIAKKVKELNSKGQPVLVGTVSIDNNQMLSEYLKAEGVKHELLNAKNHEREGEIVAQAGRFGSVTIATNMAGRGVDIKLGGNPATEEEYEKVKSAGGLFVLGTERHDARRIDNQLRGRSGRQGDPGETQFFVSLDDTLMRVFASDIIKRMMGRFNIPEDEPIQNSMITRSLESAQTKIEGFHFDARKQVLEYDDVMNYQRKVVYERRRALLLGDEAVVEGKLSEIIESGDEVFEKTLKDKREQLAEHFIPMLRRLFLQTIDLFWVDHLEVMDYMRSSVNLRAYGQRDPLVEYKREGLRLFKDMQASINAHVLNLIVHMGGTLPQAEQVALEEVHTNAQIIGGGSDTKGTGVKNSEPKVGRNDPCYCGSGKKFKKCHGV